MRENYINKKIVAFRDGLKRGEMKDCGWKFSASTDLIKAAICQAYLDASRTFSGIGGQYKNFKAFDNLAKSIQKYFEGESPKEPDEYVQKHEEWCCNLISDLKEDGYQQATYGQAQKIINMAFKYLYCCDGSEEKEEHFRYCHMALDSFILEWFWRTVLGRKHGTKGKISTWSNIEAYGDKERTNYRDKKGADKYTYYYYVKTIQDFFKDEEKIRKDFFGNYYTPFQAEFFVWPDIQLHLASEAFIFALDENITDNDKINIRKEDCIDKKIGKIRELIDRYYQ